MQWWEHQQQNTFADIGQIRNDKSDAADTARIKIVSILSPPGITVSGIGIFMQKREGSLPSLFVMLCIEAGR